MTYAIVVFTSSNLSVKINFFIVFKLENYEGVRFLWNKKNDEV